MPIRRVVGHEATDTELAHAPVSQAHGHPHTVHWWGGFNWSGVDPPLSSSRACLTAFIANSVP